MPRKPKMVIKWPKPAKPSPEVELEIVGFGALDIKAIHRRRIRHKYRLCPSCGKEFRALEGRRKCKPCKQATRAERNAREYDKIRHSKDARDRRNAKLDQRREKERHAVKDRAHYRLWGFNNHRTSE